MFLVPVLPHIAPFSFGDSPVHSGQSAQVTCLVSEGDLPLTITWSFQGKLIDSNSGVITTNIGKKANSLLIDSVSEVQSGNYTCTAQNRAGSSDYTASLDVYGIVLCLLRVSTDDGLLFKASTWLILVARSRKYGEISAAPFPISYTCS